MNNALQVALFKDGERICPSCGTPLPAHETWPGCRFRYCGSVKCTEELRRQDHGRYVEPNSIRCDADGCDNFAPEGFYGPYVSFLCCSSSCWRFRRTKRQDPVLCSCGCGEEVPHRVRNALHNRAYVSTEHHARHNHELFFASAFGHFRPVVEEYFESFAVLHYRYLASVRSALARFFRFLNDSDYKSLNEVTSATITDFLVWAHKNNRGVRTDLLSCITTFFNWLQFTGKRKGGCPVNKFLHRKKKVKHLPRPLSSDELGLAWELLHERGDARLRLACAVGEESGLRIGEICRLRVSDVDLKGRRLFVRLPNKTNRERFAFFGEKTGKYFQEWLVERDSSCGHEMLLYNYSKGRAPFTPGTLGAAFSRVLCKTYGGKDLNSRGFDRWSTHRLRHTMGTRLVAGGADVAVVLGAGGWIDPDTMAGYVKVDEAQAKSGYHTAMRIAEQQQQETPRTRVLSLREFAQRRKEEILPSSGMEANCV